MYANYELMSNIFIGKTIDLSETEVYLINFEEINTKKELQKILSQFIYHSSDRINKRNK